MESRDKVRTKWYSTPETGVGVETVDTLLASQESTFNKNPHQLLSCDFICRNL